MDAQLLKAIQYCYKLYVDGKNIMNIGNDMIDLLLKMTDSQYGYVYDYIDYPKPSLHCLSMTDISWDVPSQKLYSRMIAGEIGFDNMQSLYGIGVRSQKVIISNNPYIDNRRGGKPIFPPGHPILTSFVGIPMFFKNKFIGLIGLANRAEGYTLEFIDKFKPFTDTISHIVGSYLIEQEKEKMIQDVEMLKIKDAFLNKVTHDLRAPISSVIGLTSLIEKKTVLNTSQKDYMNMINNCSSQLLALINQMLDYSKCKAGQLSINYTSFNLRECLAECLNISAPQASEKNLLLSYTINHCVPIHICSDYIKIKQILVNLLSNAIKFTPRGYIVIYVNKNCDNKIIFNVYDTGIGIKKNNLVGIFNPFIQLKCDDYDQQIGTGLGLAICKELSNLLGGDINVESTSLGSRFYFDIITEHLDKYNYMKNKIIVIISCDHSIRMTYNNMSTKLDMIVHTFPSYQKAIKYIECNQVDLVLINVSIPKMSELESARIIKETKNIPIISISINAKLLINSGKHLSTGNGFDKNITLPVYINDLREIYADLLFTFIPTYNQTKYVPCFDDLPWFNDVLFHIKK